MHRTSFGVGPASGLLFTAALMALSCVSSLAYAAEPKASEADRRLTCREQQGQLKRLSAAIDGTACSYGIDKDKTFQLNLQSVRVDEQSPAQYEITSRVLEYGIDQDKIIEILIKYGIKFDEDSSIIDKNGNVIDYYIVKYPDPNRSGYRSIGISIKGFKLGPLVIGIFQAKII
jgi:hypothetical protein